MIRRSHLAPFLLVVGAAGCASILGDFDAPRVDDGGTGGDGGGVDATSDTSSSGGEGGPPDGATNDGPGPRDTGGTETTPPLGPLTCDTFAPATPFVVGKRNGQNPISYGDVTAFPAGPTTTRLVTSINGTPLSTIYSIDSSGAIPTVTSADIPGPGNVIATMRITGGFGVIVQTPVAPSGATVSLYKFLDASPVTPLPTPVKLATLSGITANQTHAAAVELGAGVYWLALTTVVTTPAIYGLYVGVATGGATANLTAVETSSKEDYQLPVAVHVGSTVYLYVNNKSGATGFWPLPDSGSAGGVVRKEVAGLALGALFFGGILDGVASGTAGKTNLAYLEEDANDAGNALGSLVYRAAPVDDTQLPTLGASMITFGRTYTDPAVAPFSSSARFFGDDFAIIAPGLLSGGGTTSWVNFLWLDAKGIVRGERSGAVQGLLAGVATNVERMTLAPGVRGATAATWNVAWTQFDPAAGNADTLYFDTLKCHN